MSTAVGSGVLKSSLQVYIHAGCRVILLNLISARVISIPHGHLARACTEQQPRPERAEGEKALLPQSHEPFPSPETTFATAVCLRCQRLPLLHAPRDCSSSGTKRTCCTEPRRRSPMHSAQRRDIEPQISIHMLAPAGRWGDLETGRKAPCMNPGPLRLTLT